MTRAYEIAAALREFSCWAEYGEDADEQAKMTEELSAAADLIEKLAADRKTLINELCQYCGKYKYAHEGACDGCKWRDM